MRPATTGAWTLGLALAAAVAVAAGTDLGPRFVSEDKVSGLERTRTRADGAKVVRDRVGGRGTIRAKHVVFEGIVAPGDSPGCIVSEGSVTLNATATLAMEIGGAIPCTEHDRLSVQQTLISNNPNLTVVLINGFSPTPGARFDILDWSALGGTFGNIDFSQAALVDGLS